MNKPELQGRKNEAYALIALPSKEYDEKNKAHDPKQMLHDRTNIEEVYERTSEARIRSIPYTFREAGNIPLEDGRVQDIKKGMLKALEEMPGRSLQGSFQLI